MTDISHDLTTSPPSPSPAELATASATLAARALAESLLDVVYERHDSPFGPIFAFATGQGIVRIGLPSDELDEALDQIAAKISPRVMQAVSPMIADARRTLDDYFAGRARSFDVPLDWRLTHGFRAEVLHALTAVPYGQTVTYAELAARAGRPAAVRAAGSAMATNPLPLLVPCHRVLRTGGAIGNYRGGVEMKRRLLDLEQAG